MPNWCTTQYKIVGDKSTLDKVNSLFNRVNNGEFNGKVETDFINFLGYLVMALGYDYTKFSCRGEYTNYQYDNEAMISFETTTAWCPCDGVFELIKKTYPNVSVYYQSEECGCNFYETNDVDEEYFPENYLVEGYVDNEYSCEHFEEIEDAYDYISGLVGENIQSDAEIDALNEKWKEDENKVDWWISISKFNRVSKPTLA